METKPINKQGKGDYQTSSNFLSLQGRARESRLTLETLVLSLLAAARNWNWRKKNPNQLCLQYFRISEAIPFGFKFRNPNGFRQQRGPGSLWRCLSTSIRKHRVTKAGPADVQPEIWLSALAILILTPLPACRLERGRGVWLGSPGQQQPFPTSDSCSWLCGMCRLLAGLT